MHKYVCQVLLLFISSPLFAQPLTKGQFQLSGNLKGQDSGYIFLRYTNTEGNRIKDSFYLHKGNFQFTGSISEPHSANLFSDKSKNAFDSNQVNFYLEPTVMRAELLLNRFNEAKFTGSKTQEEAEILSKAILSIKDTGATRMAKVVAAQRNFITGHPNSQVSVFHLLLNKSRWPFDTLQKYYYLLGPQALLSSNGRQLTKVIKDVEESSIGKAAKPFSSVDIEGKPLSLSSFKGKYVLLDFWASWCVPCREGNPHLRKLFNQYNKSGLEIIGISVDKNEKAWKEAVAKDSIGSWNHLISNGLNGDSVLIDRMYGATAYPTKILVDKVGVIIARYVGTEEEKQLDKKLNELFDTKGTAKQSKH
jgi:thiol-disulfide isomerase/thioredoxin